MFNINRILRNINSYLVNNHTNSYLVNNHFATNLFNITKPNSVCSPLSITFILSLLHRGLSGNTHKQITTLLNKTYDQDELNTVYAIFNNNNIKLSNAIIVNNKYKVSINYLNWLTKFCLVCVENSTNNIDNKVNQFVKNNTNGLIPKIIDKYNLFQNGLENSI